MSSDSYLTNFRLLMSGTMAYKAFETLSCSSGWCFCHWQWTGYRLSDGFTARHEIAGEWVLGARVLATSPLNCGLIFFEEKNHSKIIILSLYVVNNIGDADSSSYLSGTLTHQVICRYRLPRQSVTFRKWQHPQRLEIYENVHFIWNFFIDRVDMTVSTIFIHF